MSDDRERTPAHGEFWLSGPVDGVPPLLMPVAHAVLQARFDMRRAAGALDPHQLWARPAGAASVGFHLRHAARALGRLFTYARGEPLDDAQRAGIRSEGEPGDPPAGAAELLAELDSAVEAALRQLRGTPEQALLEFRGVGRAQLPSNALGLLFHGAEHTQRHAGQAIATAKVVAGA